MNYQQLWDGLAQHENWREYILPKRSREQFEQEGIFQAAELISYCPPFGTVVEYGVGVGRVLRHIPAKRRIGIDVSRTFLKEASKYDIEPILTEGIRIDLPSNISDFTYSLMVFQHCVKEDHPAQLKELARITKGTMLVQFPRWGYYRDFPGVNVYERDEIEAWADQLPINRYEVRLGSLAAYHDGVHPDREWFLEAS